MSNSTNAQKTAFARSINRNAEKVALQAIESLGRALPCSIVSRTGSIVTVKFEIISGFTIPPVTCPGSWSEYTRIPVQPGCKGVVDSIDTYLGGISGLGGGVADLVPRANLSSLIFRPVASADWSPSGNDNALVLYGPDGCILRDSGSATTLTVDPDDGVTIHASGGGSVLNANLVQAIDDTAAALAGVPINGLYHNINAVRIRVA